MSKRTTYSKDEMLQMIEQATWKDLEAVRVVMKQESKRYVLEDLRKIVQAYKGKIKQWAKEDAEDFKKLFGFL